MRVTRIIAILLLAPAGAPAMDWTINRIRYVDGAGFELGSSRRTHLSWEHFSGHRYGDNYFFFDVFKRDEPDNVYYGEFYTFLSLSKLFDRGFKAGPLVDVLPTAGLNVGGQPFDAEEDFRAYLLGVTLRFEVPGFQVLQLEGHAYYKDQVGADRVGTQFTPVWALPFEVAATRIVFRGFVDFRDRRATGGASEIFGQPELMWDLGHYRGSDDKLLLGIRWDLARNLFGIEGVDQDAFQAIVSYTF
jgi:nucleoside-specific outer membrane channel protein Tsx